MSDIRRPPDDRPPSDAHVILRDRRFRYLEWAGTGVEPILLLHGAGLTAHTWDPLARELAPLFRCLGIDLRGHGDSEWPNDRDYSPETHASDLAAFIDHLNFDHPIVVGMSMGGAIAVRYALDHVPRALVIIDAGPTTEPAGRRGLAEFFAAERELDTIDDFVRRALAFNPRRDPDVLRSTIVHNLIRLPNGRWSWKYDPRQFGPGRPDDDRRAYERIWRQADQLRCPTLVVRGGESQLIARGTAVRLAASIPMGRFVEIPGAGHNVQGDEPIALAEAIRAFLSGIGSPTSIG